LGKQTIEGRGTAKGHRGGGVEAKEELSNRSHVVVDEAVV